MLTSWAALSMAPMLAYGPAASSAQVPCPDRPLLPAYSHNDYASARPLWDALTLGFRGVEVDIFLRNGELSVAHDRRSVRRGRSLSSLYLEPLRGVLGRCGRIAAGPHPFLLNIELKERSSAAFDSLVKVVREYPELFGTETRPEPAVEVVLVGWHPARAKLAGTIAPVLRLQDQITDRSHQSRFDSSTIVRLVSLDYGKRIGWSGRGPPPTSLDTWLAALRRAREAGPHRLARVYNVPAEPVILRLLLSGGVDLIGIEDLHQGRRALESLKVSTFHRARNTCQTMRSVC